METFTVRIKADGKYPLPDGESLDVARVHPSISGNGVLVTPPPTCNIFRIIQAETGKEVKFQTLLEENHELTFGFHEPYRQEYDVVVELSPVGANVH